MEEELAYIYLIQDGNDRGSYVYKIGRTIQQGDSRKIKRLGNYSKGTVVHYTWKVDSEDVNEIESKIKNIFNNKFELKRGTEWFEGNVYEMKIEIDDIVKSYERTCNFCQNIRKCYWGDGCYGPCMVCTWPKVLNCSCEQKGCINCYPNCSRLFYDEDEPRSHCGNKNCNVYGCYISDNGECVSKNYMKRDYCDECKEARGYWDDRDKWQYCKKCTNFNCQLCGDGSGYIEPGIEDDSKFVRICVQCLMFRYNKLKKQTQQ